VSDARTRGRPAYTEADLAERRTRIAQAARRLFREEGYAAVSMRRLAQEVGVTPMTLYKYFPAKIDILRAIWGQVFTDLFDRVDRAVEEAGAGPRAKLLAAAGAYLAYWLERPEHYRLVFMAEGVTQPDVSVFVGDEVVLARFAVLQETLAEALGPDASEAERAQSFDLLMATLHGIAHNRITISAYPWADPQTLLSRAVDGLLGG
jgi:AcrR family transcriptional regulator